jgi:2-polyprenyl-3-methyl-5-hydroxy-6-metoxy-1,4-benzoquinol methylase
MPSAEAGFLIDSMEIGVETDMLDIPCGFGRLAIPLARGDIT